MSTAKKATKTPGRPRKVESDTPDTITLRGFTDEDHAAIDRAVERRRAMVGGFVSKNTTMIALLRLALAREDADASKGSQP